MVDYVYLFITVTINKFPGQKMSLLFKKINDGILLKLVSGPFEYSTTIQNSE